MSDYISFIEYKKRLESVLGSEFIEAIDYVKNLRYAVMKAWRYRVGIQLIPGRCLFFNDSANIISIGTSIDSIPRLVSGFCHEIDHLCHGRQSFSVEEAYALSPERYMAFQLIHEYKAYSKERETLKQLRRAGYYIRDKSNIELLKANSKKKFIEYLYTVRVNNLRQNIYYKRGFDSGRQILKTLPIGHRVT